MKIVDDGSCWQFHRRVTVPDSEWQFANHLWMFTTTLNFRLKRRLNDMPSTAQNDTHAAMDHNGHDMNTLLIISTGWYMILTMNHYDQNSSHLSIHCPIGWTKNFWSHTTCPTHWTKLMTCNPLILNLIYRPPGFRTVQIASRATSKTLASGHAKPVEVVDSAGERCMSSYADIQWLMSWLNFVYWLCISCG